MLGLLAALGVLVVGTRLRYRGKAPVSLPAGNCDASLWSHVYLPERLRVIEACAAVDGRVVSVRRESEGDVHIAVDPDDKGVLNLVNFLHGHGNLVTEVICGTVLDHGYAKTACTGFRQQVTIPTVGDRVRVIGTYVTDSESGWNEIHPVTRIETLR